MKKVERREDMSCLGRLRLIPRRRRECGGDQ